METRPFEAIIVRFEPFVSEACSLFLNGYVLGDASYVNSFTCNATGSYQRDDTEHSRAFLEGWITP